MPLTTQYHPISLYVIRGSLMQCGWIPARISQLASNQTKGTARYRVTIAKVPKHEKDASPARMKKLINDCFANDIECNEIWHKSSGIITAYLTVDLRKGDPDQLTIPEKVYILKNTLPDTDDHEGVE
jgi:hypothetical protein